MSIGQSLTEARREASMSLEQVAEATRIRQTIIESIEHDDFSRSGGDFYARAHIKGIAQAVGADPAPLLAEFDRERGQEAPAATQVFESETAARPERRGPNWTLAMAAALALVLVYGVVQAFSGSSGGNGPTVAAPGPSTSSTPSAAASTAPTTPAPAPSEAVAQAPRDSVTVVLTTAKGKSWVSATDGAGKQLFEGLIDQGQSKTFQAKDKVKLTLGNAGAVSLTVNGKDVGAPGGLGQVSRVEFTPQDPAAA